MGRRLEAAERGYPLDQCEPDPAHPGELEFGLGGGSGQFKGAASAVSPAIWRASSSICSVISAPARGRLRPWRKAFWLTRFLPLRERGPVLLPALRRFAAIWRSLAMMSRLVRNVIEADPPIVFKEPV